MANVANSVIEDTALGPCYNGISTDSINNVVINNFVIQGVHGQYGIKYYTSPGPGRRSDVFTLSNGVVQALHSGADCLLWDGMAVTLRINSVALLGCKIGMHVENSAKAKAGYPGFLFANDLETDNQTEASIIIDGGHDFHFVNSDISNTSGGRNQGSNDLDCVIVNPDIGFSYTRNIFSLAAELATAGIEPCISMLGTFISPATIFIARQKQGRMLSRRSKLGPNRPTSRLRAARSALNSAIRATPAMGWSLRRAPRAYRLPG